jgi:hypothetical protein
VMGGDGGVDEIAAQAPQTRERSLLVGAGEPAVADDVGDQNRRELPGLSLIASSGRGQTSTNAKTGQPNGVETSWRPNRRSAFDRTT